LTAGDDPGQGVARNNDGHEAPRGEHDTKRGWWKAAMERMPSFSSRKVSSTSSTQSQSSPTRRRSPIRPLAITAATTTTATATASETPRDTQAKGPAVERAADTHNGGAQRSETVSTTPWATRDFAGVQHHARTEHNAEIQVRRHVTTKTSKHNPRISRELKRLKTTNVATTIHNTGDEASTESGQTTTPAAGGVEQVTMQQQIQQLVEQVRILKKALEETTAKDRLPSRPGIQAGKVRAKVDAPQIPSSTAERRLSSIAPPSPANPVVPVIQHTAHGRSDGALLLERAWDCYRKYITVLVNIARQQDITRIGAPIVTKIQSHLITTGRDAVMRNDRRTIAILSHQRKLPGLNIVLGLATIERKYRRSTLGLARIANSLEDTTSPAVACLVTMIRDHLATVAREAVAENDVKMCQVLSTIPMLKWEDPVSTEELSDTMILSDERQLGNTREKKKTSGESDMPSDSMPSPIRYVELETNGDRRKAKNKLDVPLEPQPSATGEVLSSIRPRSLLQEKASMVSIMSDAKFDEPIVQKKEDNHRLARQIHTGQPSLTLSNRTQTSTSSVTPEVQRPDLDTKSSGSTPTSPLNTSLEITDANRLEPVPSSSDEVSEQSLLEELFPEASIPPPVQQPKKREQYPKLDLPEPANLIRRATFDHPKSLKEQVIESFEKGGERIIALQLEHCSTQLTESDFRRLIPKGKHIEAWNSDGAFYKVIPGRDPLSLERLPFYYILFKSPQAAQAYQTNASRLHKLAALHQPSNLFSAIPAPKGFIEDGEDIDAITSSYLLKTTEQALSLRVLMQPYHPSLRTLFEVGGYNPVVSGVGDRKDRSYKVLMHMEGYEPSPSDLFKTIRRDAYLRGMSLTLRNESSSSIHRLRDLINLKTRMLPISTPNPRAFGHMQLHFDDPIIASFMNSEGPIDGDNAKEINQFVMNRVYNRWILEFDDEDEARRFAIMWHRRLFPDLLKGEKTWKDYEEPRMCNCELLW
jgi:hypothetical protein